MSIHEKGRLVLVSNIVVNAQHEILLLFRRDHQWYETPGGKPEAADCVNPESPSQEDFRRAADRELQEEVGPDVRVGTPSLFVRIEFTIPDGRKAVAYKFTRPYVGGTPRVMESDRFSHVKWIPLRTLEEFPLSPDLRELAPTLKAYKRE